MTPLLSLGEFLGSLIHRGVHLGFRDGKLTVSAPVGVLTADDRAALTHHKAALMTHLVNVAAGGAFDALAKLERQVRDAPTTYTRRDARLRVIAAFRDVIRGYQDTDDPLLHQAADSITALSRQWSTADRRKETDSKERHTGKCQHQQRLW